VRILFSFFFFDLRFFSFQVNPNSTEENGFDARLETFVASRVPTLPLLVNPGSSIVKVESMTPLTDANCMPCLNKAVVFTIVASVPPNNGQFLLRPNYFGSQKYSYDVNDIDLSFLPKINPIPALSQAPSLQTIMSDFAPEKLKLDHHYGYTGRPYHPKMNMPGMNPKRISEKLEPNPNPNPNPHPNPI
jgi:hypothetical protein